MTLFEELAWRGFVNQTTLSDISLLDKHHYKLYFGVDPSADSMQVGNLAAAMAVRLFKKHGHDVTLLVGGATGVIGDPSGKDSERTLLSLKEVNRNKKAIAEQYKIIFRGEKFRLVDNFDWFKRIGYLEFLRDIGKHFSMTPLLQRDFIAKRIGPDGSGMSYAEFSYTLIQGYDFYHLFKTYGITLQLCGSDQWGNGLSGVDLIRRMTGTEVHVFSIPLVVNKTTGLKFGKTEGGAVWLDAKKTSVYAFYQFWLNSDDASVSDYLKIFTDLDKEELAQVMKSFEGQRSARAAQKRLAYEVTALVHGPEQAKRQQKIAAALFGEQSLADLHSAELAVIREELASSSAKPDTPIVDALVAVGLSSSKSEARTLLRSKAVYVNNVVVARDHFVTEDFIGGHLLLRKGKTLSNTALIDLA